MKPTWPYVNERQEVVFVDCENDTVHGLVNGALFGVLVFVPFALLL